MHNEARQVKERIGKIDLIVSLEGLEKTVRIGKSAPLKKSGLTAKNVLIARIDPLEKTDLKEMIGPVRTAPTAMIGKSVSP